MCLFSHSNFSFFFLSFFHSNFSNPFQLEVLAHIHSTLLIHSVLHQIFIDRLQGPWHSAGQLETEFLRNVPPILTHPHSNDTVPAYHACGNLVVLYVFLTWDWEVLEVRSTSSCWHPLQHLERSVLEGRLASGSIGYYLHSWDSHLTSLASAIKWIKKLNRQQLGL